MNLENSCTSFGIVVRLFATRWCLLLLCCLILTKIMEIVSKPCLGSLLPRLGYKTQVEVESSCCACLSEFLMVFVDMCKS